MTSAAGSSTAVNGELVQGNKKKKKGKKTLSQKKSPQNLNVEFTME